MTSFLTPLVTLFYNHSDYWWATWQGKWAVLLFWLSLVFSLQIAKRVHWSIAPALFISLVGGIYSGAWTFMGREAIYSVFCLMALTCFFALQCQRNINTIRVTLGAICLISLASVLEWEGGFVGNPSMNGCLIVVTAPFVGLYSIYALVLLTLLYIGQSVPIGVAVIMFLSARFARGKRLSKKAIIGICMIIIFSYIYQYPMLFNSNGRFKSWQILLSWWWSSGQTWFGLGTGSGQVIFRHINTLSPFVHNDYLQVLFENGIIGLASVLVLLIGVLIKSFDRPLLFASVCGYAVMSFFNFPAHLPVHAFVGCALIWLTYVKNQCKIY